MREPVPSPVDSLDLCSILSPVLRKKSDRQINVLCGQRYQGWGGKRLTKRAGGLLCIVGRDKNALDVFGRLLFSMIIRALQVKSAQVDKQTSV